MPYYEYYNANPCRAIVGDCVIRAISKVTNRPWEDIFYDLCTEGFRQCDLPNSNAIWGKFLRENGFRRHTVPDTCPACYTVREFCEDHPYGSFVLATGSHAVAVEDGRYFDIWDCGGETVAYYFEKEDF